jgi:hypothetical protein
MQASACHGSLQSARPSFILHARSNSTVTTLHSACGPGPYYNHIFMLIFSPRACVKATRLQTAMQVVRCVEIVPQQEHAARGLTEQPLIGIIDIQMY